MITLLQIRSSISLSAINLFPYMPLTVALICYYLDVTVPWRHWWQMWTKSAEMGFRNLTSSFRCSKIQTFYIRGGFYQHVVLPLSKILFSSVGSWPNGQENFTFSLLLVFKKKLILSKIFFRSLLFIVRLGFQKTAAKERRNFPFK